MSDGVSVPQSGFVIIPDTNVMRPNDRPEFVVAQGFTATLTKLCKAGDVKLIVPSVVRDELVAQKLRTALKTRDEIRRKAETLQQLSGLVCAQKCPTDEELRASIETTFQHWINQSSALVAETPIQSIDWKQLIDDAVFRTPPFEPATDEPKGESKEKGFKDALILETALNVEATCADTVIALVTRDALLKTSALKRLKSRLVFDSLAAFESHLKQLNDSASEDFSLQLAAAAEEAWDTSKEANLFDKLLIKEALEREFSANLANPRPRIPPSTLYISSHHSQSNVRIPLGEEVVLVSSPEYLSEVDGRWNWKTEVEMNQMFQKRVFHPESGLSPYIVGEDVRVAKFSIYWNSAKTGTPVISDPKFDHLLYGGIWSQSASTEQLMGAL